MSKQTLCDKYEIPLYSEWKHKDGGIYHVILVLHITTSKIPTVVYIKELDEVERKYFADNGIINHFVRTVNHFKRSFTQVKF
ncbi:MAG: hypothetical protein NTW78_04090 [Campylobacterales bacterium]|nr:hypothetical protein [Campylobacterales bacterium]